MSTPLYTVELRFPYGEPMLVTLKRIPNKGDHVFVDDRRFEVVQVQTRIKDNLDTYTVILGSVF